MSFVEVWTEAFMQSVEDVWLQVVGFLPTLVSAFVVFFVGWLVAVVLGKAVVRLSKAVQLDKLFDQLGVMKHLKKAGLDWQVSAFLGGLVRWFFIIVAFLAAVELLGLDQLSRYVNDVLLYIPNVVVAALILLVAALVANFLEKVVKASLRATEMPRVNLVGTVVRYSVWGFAVLAALNQLNIASSLIEILFMGFVAMLAIAGGLSLGLGGKDFAHDVLEKVRGDFAEHE